MSGKWLKTKGSIDIDKRGSHGGLRDMGVPPAGSGYNFCYAKAAPKVAALRVSIPNANKEYIYPWLFPIIIGCYGFVKGKMYGQDRP
ncbi:hypothetical protein MBAV_001113 [Candidatus Magnetobacterium bavaricum]|uniref:Uncharacterized protein n=1 Tax=Candidatus Magnetobacterium bavaricum TaxID=29290 RepID=A0A0F3H176_9BACT|nr:hypothetical protein MBAV_001113 [Candidatus Magnetobacterium bavaricum]